MPGSPDEQHHLAFALRGPLPPVEQQGHLLLAPDQRRETASRWSASKRLSARLSPRTRHARTGSGETLERLGAEVGHLEQFADQPVRSSGR